MKQDFSIFDAYAIWDYFYYWYERKFKSELPFKMDLNEKEKFGKKRSVITITKDGEILKEIISIGDTYQEMRANTVLNLLEEISLAINGMYEVE